MSYIKKIKLNNYLSFETLNLDLKDNTIYLITGINKDKGGKNGIGKSALIESIVFSIYGKNIRIGSNDINDIITHGKKSVKTEIIFDKFLIKRERNKKSKNECKIYLINKNNEIIKELTKRTPTETNKFIEETILPFNQFMYINYFNPYNLIFFSLTPKQKFEIIETLLQLNVIDELLEKYKILKDKLLENKNEILLKEKELETEIKIYNETIKKYSDELESINKKLNFYKQEINNIDTKILNNIINDIKKELEKYLKYKKKYDQIKKEFDEIKNKEININNFNINEKTQELSELSQLINILENIIKNAEKIKNKGICPICNRPFLLNEKDFIKQEIEKNKDKISDKYLENLLECPSINNIKNKIELYKEKFNKINIEIKKYNEQLSEYKYINKVKTEKEKQENILIEFVNNINETNKIHTNLIKKYNLFDTNIDEIEEKIKNDENVKKYIQQEKEKSNISGIINQIKLNEKNLKEKIKEKENIIIEKNEKLNEIQESINKIDDKIEKLKIIIKELSYNGSFRNKLIEDYLNDLEKSLNMMLSKLIDNVYIKLKIVEKGRDKGINTIIYDNNIEKSYGQLSTGEKRLIDIALLLTLSSLSNLFLLIDEALDSLSYENQKKVINLLLSLKKQVFIVTHNEKLISNIKNKEGINVIYIEKENNISEIRENND